MGTAAGPPVVRVQRGDARPAPWRVRLPRIAIRALFDLFFRLRIIGKEHIPKGPAILCVNHLGWTDAFLVLLLFPVEPRIYVLGERDSVLLSGFRVRVVNFFEIMIPLDRDRPLEALRLMKDVLHRGGSLIIFPEGTLGTQEGTIGPLEPGAAHLSLSSGIPLLPVGVTGSRELWLRRPLTLRVGPPLDPAAYADGPLRARTAALTAALDGAMRALLPGDRAPARVKLLRGWLTGLF